MPLPLITDVIRASAEGVMPNGHVWANVLHFRKTGALTYTGAIAILDPLFVALWSTALGGGQKLQAVAGPNWSLERIRYTPLDGTSATSVFPHHMVGLTNSDAMPPGVALVVTEYTAKRGRSYRGRFYISGLTEDANGGLGSLGGTYPSQIQNQVTGWLATFAATGVTPVVASYRHGTAEDVVSLAVNSVFDSQRRRARP